MHTELLKYFDHYTQKQAHCMHQQLADWSKSQPFRGLKILHHVPLVTNTLLKIACLVAAGAEVTVTNPSSFVTADPEAIACLQTSNIRYVDDLTPLRGEKFDLYFDCGAQLYQALGRPNLGAVELTASGDQYYRRQSLDFPVISIDPTLTKQLETVFGTAESANLAITKATNINPAEKSWIIFGFGKIGRGLAYFCMKHQAPVVIVDCCPNARLAAQSMGMKAIDPTDRDALQRELETADIVMTATGGKAIMDPYPRAWFNHKILANMGVYDEYGENFTNEDVLNHKAPVNFMLADPTPIQYIDPEFYAHNVAALPLLTNRVPHGIHDLAATLDQTIIERWCAYQAFPLSIIQHWFIYPEGRKVLHNDNIMVENSLFEKFQENLPSISI